MGVRTSYTQSLDLLGACRALMQVVVGQFCDYGVVYLVEGAEGARAWRRHLVVHATPQGQAIADELLAEPPLDLAFATARIARAGRAGALYLPTVGEDEVRGLMPSEAHRRLVCRRLGLHSLVMAPMVARGQLIGYVNMVRAGRSWPFLQADFVLALDLAGRAAQAVDNARSFARATEAVEARDRVSGMVSHDLRNPLNAVTLTVARLERLLAAGRAETLLAKLPGALATVVAACARMDRLAQDILTVDKGEHAEVSVVPALTPVPALMREVVAAMEPLAAARGVGLRLAAGGEGTVFCDRERLLQVFGNLVGNAIKFSPRGTTVSLAARPGPQSCTFEVADQGPGIAAENISKIFERHWQGEDAGARRQGAGLGLAIVASILRAHRSECRVRSKVGAGTSFSFALSTSPEGSGDGVARAQTRHRSSHPGG